MKPTVVEMRGVWLHLQGRAVLEAVNLSIVEGDFLGVIGPNGGGKTCLLRILLGLLTPSRGSVRVFDGKPAAARRQIGYVPQLARFDPGFPIGVLDVVLMGRLGHRGCFRTYTRQDRVAAEAALEKVGAADLRGRRMGRLSGGELQRVMIARALTVEPRLLLLDEPTASLDPERGHEFGRLLSQLSRHMTIVLVSHDLGVIASQVTSIACLNRRLHYHPTREITREVIENTHGCPVDSLVHRHVHRVVPSHPPAEES